MEARIASAASFLLVGVSFYGDPFSRSAGWTEENEIGRLCARFMRLREENPGGFPEASSLVHDGASGTSGSSMMFEAHIMDSRTEETGQYEVFFGYPVERLGNLPPMLCAKRLVSPKTAWFTLSGGSIVESDSYAAMEAWIADRGMERDGPWTCNVYDGRFKGLDRLEDSVMDVCIPVR